MSKDLAISKPSQASQGVISAEQIKTLEQAGIIPKGTPAAQIQVYAEVCAMHQLSPFAGEVHLVKYRGKEGDKYTVIVGIHGMENRAESTDEWAGYGEPQFNFTADGKFLTLTEIGQLLPDKKPLSCRIEAFRIKNGIKYSNFGQVLWSEFAGTSPQWQKMPAHMLMKCAKVMALRELFPRQTRGLRIREEMEAMENPAPLSEEAGEVMPTATPLNETDKERIKACQTSYELKALYDADKSYWKKHTQLFMDRRAELLPMEAENLIPVIQSLETSEAMHTWIESHADDLKALLSETIQAKLDELQIAGV